jgi:hypothetical protein
MKQAVRNLIIFKENQENRGIFVLLERAVEVEANMPGRMMHENTRNRDLGGQLIVLVL